jgi:tRNA threonylcarbamoyladenosine biosynthesis protein TsaB
MSFILSLETATNVCSVALHKEGELISLAELHLENIHSQKLLGLIEHVLDQASMKVSDLNAIAISGGPGSYTGLRIGASVAKGLSFAQKIPLISVCTLEALAHQCLPFAEENSYILPMIDARRMEVYALLMDDLGELVLKVQPFLLEDNPFQSIFNENRTIYILGDGAMKAVSLLNYSKIVHLPYLNSAKSIGDLAWIKFQIQDFCDIAYYEPNYLKEFKVLQSSKNPFLQ